MCHLWVAITVIIKRQFLYTNTRKPPVVIHCTRHKTTLSSPALGLICYKFLLHRNPRHFTQNTTHQYGSLYVRLYTVHKRRTGTPVLVQNRNTKGVATDTRNYWHRYIWFGRCGTCAVKARRHEPYSPVAGMSDMRLHVASLLILFCINSCQIHFPASLLYKMKSRKMEAEIRKDWQVVTLTPYEPKIYG